MKLVDDWKNAWKWISMNCMAVSVALLTSYNQLPQAMQNTVSLQTLTWITSAVLVMGMLGRLVKQDGSE